MNEQSSVKCSFAGFVGKYMRLGTFALVFYAVWRCETRETRCLEFNYPFGLNSTRRPPRICLLRSWNSNVMVEPTFIKHKRSNCLLVVPTEDTKSETTRLQTTYDPRTYAQLLVTTTKKRGNRFDVDFDFVVYNGLAMCMIGNASVIGLPVPVNTVGISVI